MAKRSIAKTAIEGGRHSHCRYDEQMEDRTERRRYRKFCDEARFDEDLDEPNGFKRGMWHLGRRNREFADKLSPVKRWLESRVGKPWNKILSEVVEVFNSRTLAGDHILGHVKNYVHDKPGDNPFDYAYKGSERPRARFPGELYVDRHGILRQEPYESRDSWRRRTYKLA